MDKCAYPNHCIENNKPQTYPEPFIGTELHFNENVEGKQHQSDSHNPIRYRYGNGLPI